MKDVFEHSGKYSSYIKEIYPLNKCSGIFAREIIGPHGVRYRQKFSL